MGASQESIKKAAINTFGAPRANIPARDALTPTMIDEAATIRDAKADAFIAAFKGKDPIPVLDRLARELEQSLQQHVDTFTTPGNAPSTIASKGADDPLVETGEMRDQAASRVIR